MTLQEFKTNLRDCDEGKPFPPKFLEDLYHSIASNPIVWDSGNDGSSSSSSSADSDGSSSGGGGGGDEDGDGGGGSGRPSVSERLTKESLGVLVRRAHAKLKTLAPYQSSAFSVTLSTQIVGIMWGLAWFKIISAISARIDTTTDVDVLHLCLGACKRGMCVCVVLVALARAGGADQRECWSAGRVFRLTSPFTFPSIVVFVSFEDGLAYGATIGVVLGEKHALERQAFTRLLAKMTFIDRNPGLSLADVCYISPFPHPFFISLVFFFEIFFFLFIHSFFCADAFDLGVRD